MPGTATDDIIDLTDIVEEGHPERPNLKPAKTAPVATDEIMGDLDLEKEIDQIFADLAPPSDGAEEKKDAKKAESDLLDLDDLFADQEASHGQDQTGGAVDGPDRTPGDDDAVQAMGFDDDFEKLFAQESDPREPESRTVEGVPSGEEGYTQPPSKDLDWPDAPGDAGEADSPQSDAFHPTHPDLSEAAGEVPGQAAERISSQAEAETDDLPSHEKPSQEHSAAAELPDVEFPPDASVTKIDATADLVEKRKSDEILPERTDARDEAEPPFVSDPRESAQIAIPDALREHLQTLETRLAALESREPAQPDNSALLAQMDERIAAAPSLSGSVAEWAERIESLELRLAALEQHDVAQPDMEELLARVDERINARIGELSPGSGDQEKLDEMAISQVDAQIQQTMEGMTGKIEGMAAKAVDAGVKEFTTSMADRFEHHFEQLLDARLDQYKAIILGEIEKKVASELGEFRQVADSQGAEGAEEARFMELAAGLDALREEVSTQLGQRDHDQDMLPQPQEQETGIIETVRRDFQNLRVEWGEKMSALAEDLENSSRGLGKLQDRIASLEGTRDVWQAAHDPGSAPDGAQEAGILSGSFLDERLAELFKSRLKAMRTELMDEMHRAVPLAAARIIREEIQALAQEEG